jgi:AraC-type DNA-binding domain-containing proteins
MRSYESNVATNSDHYVYTPSTTATNMFFYPLYCGYFHYEPNYHLKRERYDSFLIMLITKGSCSIKLANVNTTITQGQLALIDCYQPHEYYCCDHFEALWLHFDGPLARQYYEQIVATVGNIIFLKNFQFFDLLLAKIYHVFRNSEPVKEPIISKYITQILTELLLTEAPNNSTYPAKNLEDTITYINEHFPDSISLSHLAEKASLSPYYFSRLFTKETGMTPHQYLIATRLNFAKFLLKTTDMPVKEIAFSSGFSTESNFCFTFKKWYHLTPGQYRSTDKVSI